jgi:hypothetical protein
LNVLRKTKTHSDESLRVLSRLLIDEIVDDLPQSGSGCEGRSVQELKLHGRCCVVLGSPEGISKDNPGEAHEEKGTRQTLLGLCPGHDVDVTVNFLA